MSNTKNNTATVILAIRKGDGYFNIARLITDEEKQAKK